LVHIVRGYVSSFFEAGLTRIASASLESNTFEGFLFQRAPRETRDVGLLVSTAGQTQQQLGRKPIKLSDRDGIQDTKSSFMVFICKELVYQKKPTREKFGASVVRRGSKPPPGGI
jgi:hypothetical protein